MTTPATRILTNAEVHTLTDADGTIDPSRTDESADEVHEAVAIRDGRIVRVGSAYELEFLEGVETEVIDCDGRVVLPGFIDAHVHMEMLGQYQVHADLSEADSAAACQARLAAQLEDDHEWVVGFGYDESDWDDPHYLTREELDAVSEERPVAAIRIDMHTASLNGVALERLREAMPAEDVETEGGEPTGVVVETAAEVVWKAIDPDLEETRELLIAAQAYANARGVTGIHDMVRNSHAPRAYRDLRADDELTLRVRLNYWSDHLEAVREAGLRTNVGDPFVRMGAIKTYTDGSMGSRTARLFEPYEDGDGRGLWVVDPEALRAFVADADGDGYQLTAHAIGDEAIEEVLAAYETTDDPGAARHRIEHVELATDDHVDRLAETGVVASMQPNFLKWADEGGLYDQRVGVDRRNRADRLRTLADAGVALAFGSDCMPLDPLGGIHHAVTAPHEEQRLTVTEAIRAYTLGAAYAGFDEDRLGTIEPGKCADLVVLEASPWERPKRIDEIDVAMTLVDGEVVYDGR
ncbi:amidohydrolase [Natronobeatus ordinarius]|uniref:amidohydrolase n=1 Tax=Natronobeatus ordinarius TaxID=2963433 RepID=UPI0020CF88DA|nr:amidohydrolase [Natronobeatus ordinarius]